MWCHKVAWCSGYVTLLAFETFNLCSVSTKIKTLNFYSYIVNFFCNQFRDLLVENFYKVLCL